MVYNDPLACSLKPHGRFISCWSRSPLSVTLLCSLRVLFTKWQCNALRGKWEIKKQDKKSPIKVQAQACRCLKFGFYSNHNIWLYRKLSEIQRWQCLQMLCFSVCIYCSISHTHKIVSFPNLLIALYLNLRKFKPSGLPKETCSGHPGYLQPSWRA